MATHFSILAWKFPWTEKRADHGVAKSQLQLNMYTYTYKYILESLCCTLKSNTTL